MISHCEECGAYSDCYDYEGKWLCGYCKELYEAETVRAWT